MMFAIGVQPIFIHYEILMPTVELTTICWLGVGTGTHTNRDKNCLSNSFDRDLLEFSRFEFLDRAMFLHFLVCEAAHVFSPISIRKFAGSSPSDDQNKMDPKSSTNAVKN